MQSNVPLWQVIVASAAVASAITAAANGLGTWRDRVHAQRKAKAEARRSAYTEYLTFESRAPVYIEEKERKRENPFDHDFYEKRACLKVNLMLVASNEVAAAAEELEQAYPAFYKRYVELEVEDIALAAGGVLSVDNRFSRAYDEIIWPLVKNIASAMRKELLP